MLWVCINVLMLLTSIRHTSTIIQILHIHTPIIYTHNLYTPNLYTPILVDIAYIHISYIHIHIYIIIISYTIDDKDAKSDAKSLTGFTAFALWRAAYWTKQVSLTNKMLILMYWFKSAVFGRDVSQF